MTATLIAAPEKRETIDFERIDALIAWAQREYEKSLQGLPSEWDQTNWVVPEQDRDDAVEGCGTACCMAGKVGLDDGVLKFVNDDGEVVPTYQTIFADPYWLEPQEHPMPVASYAARVLGLGEFGNSYSIPLFEAHNKLGDLKRIRDNYAVRAGEPERYPHEEYRDGYDDDYDTEAL